MKKFLGATLVGCLLLLGLNAIPVRSEEQSKEVKAAVNAGLKYLVDQQIKADGHWEAFGGQYPITMTAMAGMSMLMEGSTIREGKYRENIRKAVDYLMSRAQPNGQIGNPNTPGEAGRYMYGHGFALMFLSCVYGEEEEGDRRRKLSEILTKAAQFSRDAQTRRMSPRDGKTPVGGWGYVSAKEGNNFDEGSVTITQVQALRAARNAGIKVPTEAIKDAQAYLDVSTNAQGGVIYSLGGGGGGDGRPALTAAAISCGFSAGDYNSPLVHKWFKFAEQNIARGGGRGGHDEYTHYYYAQALYILGDEGYAKLMKEVAPGDRKNWSWYKKENFPNILRSQGSDGKWDGGHAGPLFITSVNLTILQLENAALPLYQR
jgi:hypothetical protein